MKVETLSRQTPPIDSIIIDNYQQKYLMEKAGHSSLCPNTPDLAYNRPRESTASTSPGMPTLMSNTHIPFSLHHWLWACFLLHVWKSFRLYSKLENFLPHVSCRPPISISKGFNMNLLLFLISGAPESDVTLISSHMSNTKSKEFGSQE